jgi:hypothetical protein
MWFIAPVLALLAGLGLVAAAPEAETGQHPDGRHARAG